MDLFQSISHCSDILQMGEGSILCSDQKEWVDSQWFGVSMALLPIEGLNRPPDIDTGPRMVIVISPPIYCIVTYCIQLAIYSIDRLIMGKKESAAELCCTLCGYCKHCVIWQPVLYEEIIWHRDVHQEHKAAYLLDNFDAPNLLQSDSSSHYLSNAIWPCIDYFK